ncbi:MAG TPA: hypothetical protein VGN39_07100 [Terriglobales bacterium]|jgi:hypothetical protein|nr:hypothetical protein [Terriglobales bacterium]
MLKQIARGPRALVGFIAVTSFLFGQTSTPARDQLQQLTTQLQQSPRDTALRKQIITFAQGLKPPPEVPEDAVKHEGRGQYAFKNARSAKDYLDAAKEYVLALNIAPWVPGYYSDLCTIFEKAGAYLEAKENCEIYLLSLHSQADSVEAKRRIAGLDFAMDKYSPSSLQSDLSAPFDSNPAVNFPAGSKFFCKAHSDGTGKQIYREEHWVTVNGTTVTGATLTYSSPEEVAYWVGYWLGFATTRSGDPSEYEEFRSNRRSNPIVLRTFEMKREGDKFFDVRRSNATEGTEYYLLSDDRAKVTIVELGIIGEFPSSCMRR